MVHKVQQQFFDQKQASDDDAFCTDNKNYTTQHNFRIAIKAKKAIDAHMVVMFFMNEHMRNAHAEGNINNSKRCIQQFVRDKRQPAEQGKHNAFK